MNVQRFRTLSVSLCMAVWVAQAQTQDKGAASTVHFVSPKLFEKFEARGCPKRDPTTGVSLRVCEASGNRLGGTSVGESCLASLSMRDGREVTELTHSLCVLQCSGQFPKTEIPCSEPFKERDGKAVWSALGALTPEIQDQLRTDYTKLLRLKRAAEAIGEASPQQRVRSRKVFEELGGEEMRLALRREITTTVAREMLPLSLALAIAGSGNADPARYVQEPKFSAAESKNYVPLEIDRETLHLHVYESSFVENKTDGGWQARNPDELAADLLHEFFHFRQENCGYGPEWGNRFGYRSNTEERLYEIEAYAESHNSMFYREVYGSARDSMVQIGLKKNIDGFFQYWNGTALDAAEKRKIAAWAWSEPHGWMRRMMKFGGAEHGGVWAALCNINGANFCQTLSTR